MNPETITAIQTALAPVAEKIGQGAGYGWEIIVKGQVAEGWAMTMLGIALLLITLVGAYGIYKLRKVIVEETDGAGFVMATFLLLPAVFSMSFLYDGIFHLLAPEYKAIEFLLSLAGK